MASGRLTAMASCSWCRSDCDGVLWRFSVIDISSWTYPGANRARLACVYAFAAGTFQLLAMDGYLWWVNLMLICCCVGAAWFLTDRVNDASLWGPGDGENAAKTQNNEAPN